MQMPKVIAEIGVCHDGNFDKLLEMTSVAAAARCSYVKFQTRTPRQDVPESEFYVERVPPWSKDGKSIPYIEYREKMELTADQYRDINRHCNKVGIAWTTSCWGTTAVDFITSLGIDLPALKVPSCKLTNHELLRKMARWAKTSNKELWVSTGMSTSEEVSEAMSLLKDEMGSLTSTNLVLFNCNSSYPAKTSELNLSLINKWREQYDCRIGYSSHSTTLGTSVAAGILGYSHIEVHITYDRSLKYSDHPSAVGYAGLFKLMSGLKDLEEAWGPGEKVLWDSELPFRKKLRG